MHILANTHQAMSHVYVTIQEPSTTTVQVAESLPLSHFLPENRKHFFRDDDACVFQS